MADLTPYQTMCSCSLGAGGHEPTGREDDFFHQLLPLPISGQAMEIGASAISFLVATWEGHLTPPEAASMADKASKSREDTMVSFFLPLS